MKLVQSPNDYVFNVINNVLLLNRRELTPHEKFRLHAEAMAFKNTLLYLLLATHQADLTTKDIVEQGKTDEMLNFYRAILADRRILIGEIDSWANANVPLPPVENATMNPMQELVNKKVDNTK